jgi:threonine/homoserine/homoserine lactone efflux protein
MTVWGPIVLIYLLQGFTLALYATIIPGPLLAFLLSQALKHGWKRTLPAAFAPLVSDGPIIALVLLILTQTPQRFLDILRLLGGLFILYLARGAFLAFKESETTLKAAPKPGRQSLFKAIILNLLNPNPYIFWSVVAGPILISGWRVKPGFGLAFVIAFYGTFVAGLAVMIIVFSSAGKIHVGAHRGLCILSALALLAFGLYQIGVGLSAIL